MIAAWFWVIIYDGLLYEPAPAVARNLSILVGGLCLVPGIMPALFCKEMEVPEGTPMAKLSMKKLAKNCKEFMVGIKQTIRSKPFMKL